MRYWSKTVSYTHLQIAHIMGAANIIAVNRSNNALRFEIARKFGATHTICSKEQDVVEQVKEITRGEMVPVIIDCAGKNDVLEKALHLLQKGGEFVRVGYDKEPCLLYTSTSNGKI